MKSSDVNSFVSSFNNRQDHFKDTKVEIKENNHCTVYLSVKIKEQLSRVSLSQLKGSKDMIEIMVQSHFYGIVRFKTFELK